MDEVNKRVRQLAFWGIPLALAVMGLKMLAWYVTGSVALLSDGLESTVNVIAAFIAWMVVGYAAKPADEDHPFGHYKAEYVSAVVEGVLIVVAALLIVQEAAGALVAPALPDAPALGLGQERVAHDAILFPGLEHGIERTVLPFNQVARPRHAHFIPLVRLEIEVVIPTVEIPQAVGRGVAILGVVARWRRQHPVSQVP